MNKVSPRFLEHTNCWEVSGVRRADEFFRAVALLVPDATHLLLEGAPAREVAGLIAVHVDEQSDYQAPRGTLWSLPPSRRFSLRASLSLYAQLREAAAHHAEPEICYHLHIYRDKEPLVQWFDAFGDPMLVAKSIPRAQVEQFCSEVGGTLAEPAG